MTTDAERWAVDTSVAVAALDAAHAAHRECVQVVRDRRPAIAGHAAFETFSVLTRMPGMLAVSAPVAGSLVARVFPEVLWLGAAESAALLERLAKVGVTGGAVYDAMVGEAARMSEARLLTRDHRAGRTYDLLGVDYELID